MTVIVIGNPIGDATAPPVAPTKDDGTRFRFEMIFDGGRWRAYADEPVDLVGELIGDYSTLASPVERAQARITYAVTVQVAVQASLNNEFGLHGCTDTERELLQGPRHDPPAGDQWRAPVPLVLVRTFYQPVGPRSAPTAVAPGEIWWLDPGDDITLLTSLHRLAVITLAAVEPDAELDAEPSSTAEAG